MREETCPSFSGGTNLPCEPGEKCAATGFAVNPQLICCPADGVLCDLGGGVPVAIDLCCPEGDTCETQNFGGTTVGRCSSQGELCTSESSGFVYCELGGTCAITAIDVSNPLSSPIGCCAAGSMLCPPPDGSTVTFNLCCPASATCETVTGGATPYARCAA